MRKQLVTNINKFLQSHSDRLINWSAQYGRVGLIIFEVIAGCILVLFSVGCIIVLNFCLMGMGLNPAISRIVSPVLSVGIFVTTAIIEYRRVIKK